MELTLTQFILIASVPAVLAVVIVARICYITLRSFKRTVEDNRSPVSNRVINGLVDQLENHRKRIDGLNREITKYCFQIESYNRTLPVCDRCGAKDPGMITLIGGLRLFLCKECSTEWNRFAEGIQQFVDVYIIDARGIAINRGVIKIPQNKYDESIMEMQNKRLVVMNQLHEISVAWVKSTKGTNNTNHYLTTGKYLDAIKYFNITSLIDEDDTKEEYEGPHRLSDFVEPVPTNELTSVKEKPE